MSVSPEFKDYLHDLFDPVGPVTVRNMFGGAGVFRDSLMFGLIADEVLFLKVDKENQPDFEAAGSEPFTYEGKGKPVRMSYWECPADVMEDPEAFGDWARKAYDAALRADRKKGKKK